jgi:glycosyltransferase involved in cell wall biosynthesis
MLYRAATAALLCSEGEGFGLPLIEAARQSVPIIARELPVFREIAGEHAYYFSGESASGLADALVRWLELYKANKVPSSKGIEVPTWRDSAKRLLSLIDQMYAPENSAS